MQARQRKSRSWWPLLVALPPAAALLGGIATVYLATRHPDKVVPITQVKDHVTNSVVPPLR